MQRKEMYSRIYIAIVSVVGIFAFLVFHPVHFRQIFDSFLSFAILGALLLLTHYTIYFPPDENNVSMDSAIFLAILFLYGVEFTLNILLLHGIIYFFIKFNTIWWKHLFNFSAYTLMILTAYGIFSISGGVVGEIETNQLLPYVAALSCYFVVNIVLTGIFFLLSRNEGPKVVIREMLKDKTFLISYSNTLLFSLVLGVLIFHEGIFGLFLFVCVAMLVAFAFKQYYSLYQDISNKAKKDFLTGLNNHGFFKELLEKEVLLSRKKMQPLSLVLIDLDDFKKYNDHYGHIQGDYLLKEFGRLLDLHVSSENFISARYGGEEFAILMPNTSGRKALQFVERLRKRVNNTIFDGAEILPYQCLSFSAGIAELEKGTYNTSELIDKADQAMYYSKSQGKNMVQVYYESLQKSPSFFESELEKADLQLKLFLAKDLQTYRHCKRVYQNAIQFSKKLNLSAHEKKILLLGALVHDIGKLELPKHILQKEGKLDPTEWELVKNHVAFGRDIISTNKQWTEILPLVELHHEHYDGNGYPYGLKGENIPRLARIMCIIDSFDAMTTERPYQRAKTLEEAIIEIRNCSGTQFDPELARLFIELIEEQHLLLTKI